MAIVQPENTDIEIKHVTYEINTHNLEKYLDLPTTDDFYFEGINQSLPVGCSNGLAYLNDGYGAVLKIQFVRNEFGKKEGELTHTGSLGDVMKESVAVVKMAALNYLA
jgi:ATP-dependent Lon protease